jgi:hypothetical protein
LISGRKLPESRVRRKRPERAEPEVHEILSDQELRT